DNPKIGGQYEQFDDENDSIYDDVSQESSESSEEYSEMEQEDVITPDELADLEREQLQQMPEVTQITENEEKTGKHLHKQVKTQSVSLSNALNELKTTQFIVERPDKVLIEKLYVLQREI
ncbi:MAG: hypothetical protein EZS28_055855, partial [Streblomastix strix]